MELTIHSNSRYSSNENQPLLGSICENVNYQAGNPECIWAAQIDYDTKLKREIKN